MIQFLIQLFDEYFDRSLQEWILSHIPLAVWGLGYARGIIDG